ncbi:MAG: hypothetical protein ACYC1B_08990 [Thermoleophilia bacterium]
MIRESILTELKRRYPAESYCVGDEGNTVAVFPAKCPEVGKVTIWDDGDEATVLIENITHGHFNPYDESLSEAERDKEITEEVCDFLDALFRDDVLLWTSGRAGGWARLDLREEGEKEDDVISGLQRDAKYFVWSGPRKRGQRQNEPYSKKRAFWNTVILSVSL